jgi:hypothetical protein
MVDFWQTLEGQQFRSQLKTLGRTLAEHNERENNKEYQVEKLEKQIYAQLVANDFYQDNGISYDELKRKAKEAAKAYFFEEYVV